MYQMVKGTLKIVRRIERISRITFILIKFLLLLFLKALSYISANGSLLLKIEKIQSSLKSALKIPYGAPAKKASANMKLTTFLLNSLSFSNMFHLSFDLNILIVNNKILKLLINCNSRYYCCQSFCNNILLF